MGTLLLAMVISQPADAKGLAIDSAAVAALVSAGTKCAPQKVSPEFVECSIVVDNLRLTLAGKGRADAQVYFTKSDADAEWYATFSSLSGCVLVKPGKANKRFSVLSMAYLSPISGRSFDSAEACLVENARAKK